MDNTTSDMNELEVITKTVEAASPKSVKPCIQGTCLFNFVAMAPVITRPIKLPNPIIMTQADISCGER